MWSLIVELINKLFGGGTSQFGKGNISASGTTSGHNSPIVNASGNVVIGTTSVALDPYEEVFKDLESLMPDVMGQMRLWLLSEPLIRHFMHTDTQNHKFHMGVAHWMISDDMHDKLREKINVLVSHGLVNEGPSSRLYLLTERFATYLRRGR